MFVESINDNNSYIDRAYIMCRYYGERCVCVILFSFRRSFMRWIRFLFLFDSGIYGGLGRFFNLRWSWNLNLSLFSYFGIGEGFGFVIRGEAVGGRWGSRCLCVR